MDIVASRQHGVWLRELVEMFEIRWVSTWGSTANDTFGYLFDLPRFDAIDLGAMPRAGTRKLRAVSDAVGDRAVAWVDDELYEDANAWAAERRHPTLLVRTSPTVGLRSEHVESLREFADSALRGGGDDATGSA